MAAPTSAGAREWSLRALGALLLLGGLSIGWARTTTKMEGEGADFAVLHVMGVGLARAANVYELNQSPALRRNVRGVSYPPGAMGLVVYPPATGFPMLPLAVLPYSVAKIVWFLIVNTTLILGIRRLVRVAAPTQKPHAWLLAGGVVMLSAAIRWGMMLLQGAPLVLGLLCFFVAALHERRSWSTLVIAVLATAFKMTLALPFLGLLLLHRRFGAFIASVGAWFMLNVLGFLRMGHAAFETYQRSVSRFEDVRDVTNINSPDPWTLVSLPRLDWVYLFYGVTGDVSISRVASLGCSAAVALWLLRLGVRDRSRTTLSTTVRFLAPLVCLGSLCVYHHQYDLCLFFVPLLLAYFVLRPTLQPAWAVWLVAPVVLVMLFMPIGTASHWAQALFGDRGVGVLKLTFPIVVTSALVGSLAILARSVGRQSSAGVLAEVSAG